MVEDIRFPPQQCTPKQKSLSSVSLATDNSLCGGSLLANLRAKPPLKGEVPAIGGRRGSFPTPQGRGGSVSRRDHTQAYRRSTALTWVRKPEGTHKPIPSHSSGEGVWGRGASLREAASPPAFPHRSLFGRGPGGGASLREAASPGVLPLVIFGREREGGGFWNRSLRPLKNAMFSREGMAF